MKARLLNQFILSSSLILSSLSACSTTESTQPGQAPLPAVSDPAQKTLFAVYMVGSDIEDDIKPRNGKADEAEKGGQSTVGAGTSDVREMLDAWQNMSSSERSGLDVIVAFGGARKAGWQGVKYADLNCLQEDMQDEYLGNAECYQYQAPETSMSNQAALSHFLSFLKDEYPEPQRRIFQFWNHGLAYLGVGYDTTSKKSHDYITLPEMKNSLAETRSQFDLIGFDACLMASLEVAQAVAPHGKYMLASEDLEPGHGWHYQDVLTILAQGRNSEIPQLGQKLVDSFLDHPNHQRNTSQNKTLSLMDLSQSDAVVNAINTVVQALNVDNFQPLLSALENSQRFGEEPRNDLDYSIDLKDWLSQLEKQHSEVSTLSQKAQNILKSMVLYERHDTTRPQSNGLSIYSLNAKMKSNYGADESVSEPWLEFAGRFITRGNNDGQAPQIGGFQTQQAVQNLCTQKNQQGHCFEIEDNVGLKRVEQIYGLHVDERFIFQIGSERLEAQNGQYFAPIWNGEWLLLCNGNCESGLSVFPPAYFNGVTERNTRLYTSEAQLNGNDVVFYIEIGQNNAVVNSWAVPYEIGAQGEAIMARHILELQAGDNIRFYFRVNDLQNGQLRWQAGEALTLSQGPAWSFAQLKAPRRYFVQALDYQGNVAVSDLYAVK